MPKALSSFDGIAFILIVSTTNDAHSFTQKKKEPMKDEDKKKPITNWLRQYSKNNPIIYYQTFKQIEQLSLNGYNRASK